MNHFGVDENGMIITEVSREKIAPQFMHAVDHVLDSLIHTFSSELEAIYLYGSVVTGKAIERQSDLDMILVFKEQPDNETRERISSLERNLTEQYELTFRDVGLGVTYVSDICSENEKYGGMCFLKHLCVCVYGNDLTKDVEGFRPSREVAKGFNGDLTQSLEAARSKLDKSISEKEVRRLAQSVAKKIIRTGFSLVMPRAQCWTADLQTSCATFLRYYPAKHKEMSTALEWSMNGHSSKQAVLEFIDEFGSWLASEFDREILAE